MPDVASAIKLRTLSSCDEMGGDDVARPQGANDRCFGTSLFYGPLLIYISILCVDPLVMLDILHRYLISLAAMLVSESRCYFTSNIWRHSSW